MATEDDIIFPPVFNLGNQVRLLLILLGDEHDISQFFSLVDGLLQVGNLGSERNNLFCFNRIIPIELITSLTSVK